MPYMVSTGMSVHWVKRIEASSFTPGALRLAFLGDSDAKPDQTNATDITIFMDDHDLVERLVTAINSQNIEIEPASTPSHLWKGEDDEPAF